MSKLCFSYPSDVSASSDPRRMHTGSSCFSYSAEEPRRMHTGTTCFSYTSAAPQPAPPGLHRMVNTACFRY
jgi:hypothetical protein